MKGRTMIAAVLVAALAVSASTAAGAVRTPSGQTAKTLTVWLQVDAQSGWPDIVAAANKQFESDHSGYNVVVQYQGWPDHLQKFDATLAANTSPDVIEMGNTEMTKYMAAARSRLSTSRRSTTPATGCRASPSPGTSAARPTAFRTTRARAS